MYVESDGRDIITDLIVVGSGPGGLAAVGSAIEAGAQVVAIEAYKDIGGNGIWSTGWVAFVNTQMQRQQGIQDSVELFMKDCQKLIDESSTRYGLQWDPVITRLYAEESAQMHDILTKRGVKFPRLIKRPIQTSVPRLAAVESTDQFARAFEQDFGGPNVRTYLNSRMVRLLAENGRVIGIRVQPNDSKPAFNVFATKGVILATGGYQANPFLRQHYEPTNFEAPYPGLPFCRGDGHLLGQAVGGDLINMSMIPPIVMVASALTDEAIAVNGEGCRFHDEAGPYQYRVEKLKMQPEQRGYYIFDNATAQSKSRYVDQLGGYKVEAESLEELAKQIQVPAASLINTVNLWNDFVKSGGKMEPTTKRVDFTSKTISQAPFYASPMIPGVSLTCGGFRTTTSMQVVDIFGDPIPGLFAVGDVAGGLTPTAEMGGTHLGGGFVHGWRAGNAVVTGNLAQSHYKDGGTFGQFVAQKQTPTSRIPIINVTAAEQTAGLKVRL